MIKTFCDKCKREIKEPETYYNVVVYEYKNDGSDSESVVDEEICSDCFQKLNIDGVQIKYTKPDIEEIVDSKKE